MKAAVATFAYPAPLIEQYAEECLCSLAKQTDTDFVLFVFNDGLTAMEDIISHSGMNAEMIAVTGNPAGIRRQGIQHIAALGFDIIIFADIDDVFDEKRVEIAKKMLADDVDVVVNELVLFGEGTIDAYHMLGGRLAEGEELGQDDIRQGNCFGMSNTALRISAIPLAVFEDKQVVAFDWFLYAHVLANHARARYTQKTRTFYRQHANNTASIRVLSDANIVRGLEIKRQHFWAMGDGHADELAATRDHISRNSGEAAKYFDAVRAAMPSHPFWWEPIMTFKELGL
jgi:glycosyltransferase involved in cell wall biosynthesis